jgi:hypothetical protein
VDVLDWRWGFCGCVQGFEWVVGFDGGQFGASLVWGEAAKADEVDTEGG